MMKRKYQRLIIILIAISSISFGVYLVLQNFNQNIIFYYTPTELQHVSKTEKRIRVGGLIEHNSISRDPISGTIEFLLTDLNHNIKIRYHGILPNLFADGQGMVARGILDENSVLIADELLTKHDENYMPKEVVKTLQASGKWNK